MSALTILKPLAKEIQHCLLSYASIYANLQLAKSCLANVQRLCMWIICQSIKRGVMAQDNYHIIGNQLGAGVNGQVHNLTAPSLSNTVIKTGVLGHLRQEADVMRICHHPNVARTHALLLPQGALDFDPQAQGYMAMECLGCGLNTMIYPKSRYAPAHS